MNRPDLEKILGPREDWTVTVGELLTQRSELARCALEAEARLGRAVEALKEVLDLAAVAHYGDPWYAEHEGIDAESVLAKGRAVLAEQEKEQPHIRGGQRCRN